MYDNNVRTTRKMPAWCNGVKSAQCNYKTPARCLKDPLGENIKTSATCMIITSAQSLKRPHR